MPKTQVDLDDELVAAAAHELGTTTKKDTIHAALRLAAHRADRTRSLLEIPEGDDRYLSIGVGPDVADPDVMDEARR